MPLPEFGQPIARIDFDLADIGDINIVAPAAGDILIYDGDSWDNQPVTGDITITAGGVVAIVPGTPRQILQTDAAGTAVEWTSNMDTVTIGATTPAPGTFNTLTKTGTTGLTWTNVSDEDYEIFFLSAVTGGPRWIWDETEDAWSTNFGIEITNGAIDFNSQGSIQNIGAAGNDFGAAQLDLAAGYTILGANALAINTTAGDITVGAAAGADVLIGDDVTILRVDGGTGTVGIGIAANTAYALHVQVDFDEVDEDKYGAFIIGFGYETDGATGNVIGGVFGRGRIGGSNNQNWTSLVGVFGVQGQAIMDGGSGIITGAAALRALNASLSGVTLVNQYGYHAPALTGATNNYQIGMLVGGTEPTTAMVNGVGLYAVDVSGNSVLGLIVETAVAADADETKFSNKIAVRINGATYFVMLTVT